MEKSKIKIICKTETKRVITYTESGRNESFIMRIMKYCMINQTFRSNSNVDVFDRDAMRVLVKYVICR
jgi:hypothetical protein